MYVCIYTLPAALVQGTVAVMLAPTNGQEIS